MHTPSGSFQPEPPTEQQMLALLGAGHPVLPEAPARRRGLVVELQPIVEVTSGRVVGAEAFARFPATGLGPAEVFSRARALGRLVELELAAASAALELLGSLPQGSFLSLNLSPETLCDPDLSEVLEGQPPERVVLELAGRRADDPPYTLQRLRSAGFRWALKGTGELFFGYGRLLRLRPDIVKIDLSVTHNLERLARHATRFLQACRLAGIRPVAEGVETVAQLEQVAAAGIEWAQGRAIAPPGPPPPAFVS